MRFFLTLLLFCLPVQAFAQDKLNLDFLDFSAEKKKDTSTQLAKCSGMYFFFAETNSQPEGTATIDELLDSSVKWKTSAHAMLVLTRDGQSLEESYEAINEIGADTYANYMELFIQDNAATQKELLATFNKTCKPLASLQHGVFVLTEKAIDKIKTSDSTE